MKSPESAFAAIVLLAALAPPQLTAQDNQDHRHKHHHYQVVDLGALGGNNSFTPFPAARTLNQVGIAVAEADTSTPDPYAPNCFQTLFGECLVNHTLRWKNATTDLGALAGVNSSFPVWINDGGLVSGFSENGLIDPLTGFPEVEGALWKQGKIIPLGTLGGNASYGNAINNRGQVAGFALNTILDPFAGTLALGPSFPVATESHAFLWDTKNGMRDLGTLGSGPDSEAFYVNESGQVVGISYINSTANTDNGPVCTPNVPTEDPFLWENGVMTDLGSLGGNCGFPFALNNRGEVVGNATLAGNASNNVPFLWTKGTGMQRLPSVGGTFGEAYSINDAGQIAGWASPPGDTAAHAVLWEEGKAKDLGVLGNASCNIGLWINSREQVVGFAGVDSCNTSNESAFLSEDGGPLVDLNTLVSPNSGVYLAEAKTINDRGEIVGDGFLPNGDVHAILLIPCDEQHPGVEGCDYSLVDAPVAVRAATRNANSQVPQQSVLPRMRRSHFPGRELRPMN
jgi:probable HAF family extracellular repeat protein